MDAFCKQPPNKLDKSWQSDCATKKSTKMSIARFGGLKWNLGFGFCANHIVMFVRHHEPDLSLTKRWIFRSRDRCCLRCQSMVKSRTKEPMFKIFLRNLQRMLPFCINLTIEPQESQQFDRCPTKSIGKLQLVLVVVVVVIIVLVVLVLIQAGRLSECSC